MVRQEVGPSTEVVRCYRNLKQYYKDLKDAKQPLVNLEPAWMNKIEKLNKEIQKCFTVPLDGSGELALGWGIPAHDEDEPAHGEGLGIGWDGGVREVHFRRISTQEDQTFIALFKEVKTTPRKMKRVINM